MSVELGCEPPATRGVTADAIDDTALRVHTVLPGPARRMDLETKFVLWLFGLIAAGCIAVYELVAQRVSLLVTVVLIGACVGAVGSALAHYLLFKPIRQLATMAKAVGSGDFSKRLHIERRDEIGSLAFYMDSMCDQLQAAQHASEVHIAGSSSCGTRIASRRSADSRRRSRTSSAIRST